MILDYLNFPMSKPHRQVCKYGPHLAGRKVICFSIFVKQSSDHGKHIIMVQSSSDWGCLIGITLFAWQKKKNRRPLHVSPDIQNSCIFDLNNSTFHILHVLRMNFRVQFFSGVYSTAKVHLKYVKCWVVQINDTRIFILFTDAFLGMLMGS